MKKTLFMASLLLLVSNANAQLNVSPLADIPALELQQLQLPSVVDSTALDYKNQYRWWLNAEQGQSLKKVELLTLNAKPVEFDKTMLTNNLNCYLLMVDTSLSMGPFLKNTKQAMKTWVDNINNDKAIFGFAEYIHEIVPFSSGLTNDEIKQKIDAVKLEGRNTQLYLAVSEGIKRVVNCSAVNKNLVIFSDGDAEDKAHTLKSVIAEANDKQVIVHTVGFGKKSKTGVVLKLEVLRNLSNSTNGLYQHFSNIAELQNAIYAQQSKPTLASVISVNSTLLPYGTEKLELVVSLENSNGQIKQFKNVISVTDTKQFVNILVSIRDYTGVNNPWLVIAAVVVILLLLLLLIILLLKRKKRQRQLIKQKEEERQALLIKQQARQNKEMQEAIAEVNEKIDDFSPEALVDDAGVPFANFQDQQGRIYSLVYYSTTIGRSEENQVVIEDKYVSSQHAILDFKNGVFIWTDRAPSNPTKINGEPIAGSSIINPGDKLTCGMTELTFNLI